MWMNDVLRNWKYFCGVELSLWNEYLNKGTTNWQLVCGAINSHLVLMIGLPLEFSLQLQIPLLGLESRLTYYTCKIK